MNTFQYITMFVVAMIINLVTFAAMVWIAIKILQVMGVL